MTYGYISSIAVFFYILLLLIMLAARRNKLANSFVLLLCSMILWTGGSAMMRALAWPGYRIWYHVSLLGLLLLPWCYHKFITTFAGKTKRFANYVILIVFLICFLVNIPNGFLLAPPTAVGTGSDVTFIYSYNWHVIILIVVLLLAVIYDIITLIQLSRKKRDMRRQFRPIVYGILILALGQLLIMLPLFEGFPVDIISGMINAVLIFYALTKRRLFKLQLLASEKLCLGVGLLMTFMLYINLTPYFTKFLETRFPGAYIYYALILLVCFLLTTLILSTVWHAVMRNVFIKEEIIKTEYLQHYSNKVSKSLRVKEIMEETIKVTKKVTSAEGVYICLRQEDGSYQASYSDMPLNDLHFSLSNGNPLVTYLMKRDEGVLVDDFRSTVLYKSMWEEEKRILRNLNIVACTGLQDEDDLIGVILLSERKGRKNISHEHLQLMNSVSSVASIALKNAHLYEKAYYEARTDELTGLLNRKYFHEILEEEFTKNKDSSMSLIIINIDDFKLFNQLYGSKQGDEALIRIAEIIKATVGANGHVARYTGKEFAILLPRFDVYGAKNLTETICRQIYNMNNNSREWKYKAITVSAGISATPYAARSVKELLNNVDMAVYHVKHHGKNGIEVFDTMVNDLDSLNKSSIAHEDVYNSYEATIYALTAAIDAKDHYTFKHSNRVAYYATELAKAMKLNPEIIEIIRQAALLHDVGKIGIPENVLNKPDRLNDDEYSIIKGHVEASIDIIRHLPSLDYVIPAVIGHHERYDGKGYPRRIAGENIPLTARILCVADSFDAMTSKRCYRNPLSLERALSIMEEESGKQFDPKIALVFVDCVKKGTIQLQD